MILSTPNSHVIRIGTMCLLLVVSFATGAFFGSRFAISHGLEEPPPALVVVSGDYAVPHPSLAPRQVVEFQLQGLRKSDRNPEALRQCYRFSSAANRSVTGPLERFEQLVYSPEYRPLITQWHAIIGEAVERENYATVLVTVVDRQQRLVAYRFQLSKQNAPPYQDCWMTDAVSRVEFPSAAPPPAEAIDV